MALVNHPTPTWIDPSDMLVCKGYKRDHVRSHASNFVQIGEFTFEKSLDMPYFKHFTRSLPEKIHVSDSTMHYQMTITLTSSDLVTLRNFRDGLGNIHDVCDVMVNMLKPLRANNAFMGSNQYILLKVLCGVTCIVWLFLQIIRVQLSWR